jgi:uncharacterized membrane protein (DUF2068 family)
MEPRRWLNSSQPPTLQNAVVLCYLDAVLGLFSALVAGGVGLLLLVPILLGVGGLGIANEKRWGYWLAVVLAGLSLLLAVVVMALSPGIGAVLNLLFDGALVALLLHPMSRQYQRLWFHR